MRPLQAKDDKKCRKEAKKAKREKIALGIRTPQQKGLERLNAGKKSLNFALTVRTLDQGKFWAFECQEEKGSPEFELLFLQFETCES